MVRARQGLVLRNRFGRTISRALTSNLQASNHLLGFSVWIGFQGVSTLLKTCSDPWRVLASQSHSSAKMHVATQLRSRVARPGLPRSETGRLRLMQLREEEVYFAENHLH